MRRPKGELHTGITQFDSSDMGVTYQMRAICKIHFAASSSTLATSFGDKKSSNLPGQQCIHLHFALIVFLSTVFVLISAVKTKYNDF
jgi:hypothetical protein